MDGKDSSVTITCDLASSFTYASYQNAVPVIRLIKIRNGSPDLLTGLKLELTSSPSFLRPKTWVIDRILPGEELHLSDRRLELDAGYLAGLNEAERGDVNLTLISADGPLLETQLPVRLLARDEWGGVADMAQLLPAFVMPNDPAVPRILRSAAKQLAAHGHHSGLDGYQSKDPRRAYMLAASVYSSVSGLGLHYAEPPASFELRGQKVRRPTDIAEQRLATCLDLTLLLAAAIEACGLNPVILLFRGHAAVGAWLTPRTLANAIEPDLLEIRKALSLKELLVFETTGLTHRPAVTLDQASKLVERRLDESQRDDFVAAIDVRRSRSGGITPLASHESFKRGPEAEEAGEPALLPLPAQPDFGSMPVETVEEKPTTAAGRIDRWQKKLLDLTLRNRLLNFPDTQKTIPFVCTDVSYLEDRLAAGTSIRLISLPEQNPVGERDESLFREVRGEDLQKKFAADALQRDELPSSLTSKELEKRLIDLHRQVRNDFAEGGANTLFLAVGFLRWKKKPEDLRSYRAPLLLVPVKLERKSASSRFSLRFHEDEPRFNATLLQFLERDFDLSLPQFTAPLPLDESGIDVPRVLASMRQAVRDVPGMEVLDETALSTFSFAKFLMWKDLVERTDALRQNRVVKHLIDTPDQSFSDGSATFIDERDIDRKYEPKDIVCLLPADSSQIAASLAAAEGRDFVVVGPPGTGKSQTIANMIAHCLAVGKTVLFVAEKTAALDVVHRRLKENGLGDHCLELHSSRTDRKSFVGQLKRAWESSTRHSDAEWVQVNGRLRLRRDQLNAYADALHHRYPNGLSIYRAIGAASKGEGQHAPALAFPSIDAHDEPTYAGLAVLAADVGRIFAAVPRRPSLALVNVPEWSSAWQETVLKEASNLGESLARARTAMSVFASATGVPEKTDPSLSELESLEALADTLADTAGTDVSIAFDREFQSLRSALSELEAAIADYRSAEAGLTAPFAHEALDEIPIDRLEEEWRLASASIWPMSWLGRRKIRKLLQSYAVSGTPDPERDLSTLKRMKQQAKAVKASPLAAKRSGFTGITSDTAAMERRIAGAERVRTSIERLAQAGAQIRAIVQHVAPALQSASADAPVRLAAQSFKKAFTGLRSAIESFGHSASIESATVYGMSLFSQLPAHLADLGTSRQLLRDWTTWVRIRQEAVAKGLEPLVSDVERGAVPSPDSEAAFHLAYARWWLPLVLDTVPVLRDFRRFEHEHAIADFRDIDDLVRKAAAGRVVSALAHGLPPVQSVPRQSELGLLRHQMELQRPSRSIREMIGAMPGHFAKLAPCMLMSPLSIAQYLPPDQALFDVVIFDEASQITTWDAVGAIARGRQTIIVGDPKQLPPTNFFGRNEEEEDVEEYERDLESILDEAKTAGIPVRDLRWHYRSRNESLIAFSNHHYYQNRLITFPSPQVEDRAVRLRAVLDGIYDRGKSRTNKVEARAVASDAVSRMLKWLKLEEQKRPTIGIITFNAQQQSLIQDHLDEARRSYPELEWFFSEDRVEPTIVKNLENVQGDERDVILFSITFTQDAAGKRSMDFGALNRDGGERRLNVAVTRARQELVVFSGFRADQIDTSRTRALGVHHLKTFLDFADRGAIALPAQDQGSVGGMDSPFEEAVAAELSKRGWHLVPQVGISGFRIDLGVRHPDKAGAYLAGAECDGATYHSSATARDRDKIREQVLRGLGWSILRVWSTDWWFDAKGTAERLHGELNRLLEEDRARAAVEAAEEERAGVELESATASAIDVSLDEDDQISEPTGNNVSMVPVAQGSAETAAAALGARGYRAADLSTISALPDQFYEFSYRTTLRAIVDAVMDAEGPLREDVLAQRIARAHGWLRTGQRIREQIDRHLKDFDRTTESSGIFIWEKGTVADCVSYRPPSSLEHRRAIPEIPLAELVGLVRAHPDLADHYDPALALARMIGVERLAIPSRQRLDEALEAALQAPLSENGRQIDGVV